MSYVKNGTPVGGASLSDATPAALGTAAAGVSTSASRADHVHAAPAAAGITDVSATGLSLVTAASAAAARTAIGAETAGAAAAVTTTSIGAVPTSRTVAGAALSGDVSAATLRTNIRLTNAVETDPLTSTSGGLATWTAVAVSGCTQSIASGLVTLTTPSGQASISGTDYLQYHRATGVEGARGVDVAVRVASFSGTLGTRRVNLVLSGRAVPLGTTPSGSELAIWCAVSDVDGRMVVGEYVGATFTTRLTAAASQLPLDGTGWMRVIVSPVGYSAWTGVGATAGTPIESVVWTRRASVAWTDTAGTAMGEVTRMSLAAYRATSQAEAFVASFAGLRIVGL